MSTKTQTQAHTPVPARPERQQAPWLTVMIREITVKLTDKAFLISTLVTLLFVIGSVGASAWFAGRAETTKLAVVGPQAEQVAAVMEKLDKAQNEKNRIELTKVPDAAAGEQALRDGTVSVLLAPSPDAAGPAWQMVTKGDPDSRVQSLAEQALQQLTTVQLAQQAGVDVGELQRQSTVAPRSLEVDQERFNAARVMSLAFSVLFLMAALTYGMQIATSVIEEKQSRIVEILVAAITVRQLLAGKILGNATMAMLQMALLTGVGLLGLSFTPAKEMLPAIGGAVGWYLVLFLAGFLALAAIWAAAGSLGQRNEDLQYTSQPLTFLLLAVYMAGFLATGAVRDVLSYVPIISVILMPARVVAGTAHWWDLVIAVVLNIAFAALTVWFGERVYRRAILRTGKRLSFKDALKSEA